MPYETGRVIELLVVTQKNERGLPIGHVLAVDPDDERLVGLKKVLRSITKPIEIVDFNQLVVGEWPKEKS
jgi:hypothetical protein